MGNDLVYRTHDLEKIASRVEEVVRRDVGSSVPVPVRTNPDGTDPLGARSYLADLGRLLAERPGAGLATLEFDLPGSHGAHLIVRVVRNGLTAYVASLIFSMDLRSSVDAPVGLAEHRMFGKPAFVGGRSAERLNGVDGLAKRADDALTDVTVLGALTLRLPRIFELGLAEAGSRLVVRTLPHKASLFGPMSTSAGAILAIADAIEAAL